MFSQEFKEEPVLEMPIDRNTFKRGGGFATAFFNPLDKSNPEFSSKAKEIMGILDVYRFRFRLGAMDKGELIQALVNESRATDLYRGWAKMEAAVECRGMEVLDKVTEEHKSAAMVIGGAVAKNNGIDKFNKSHRIARIAKALDITKLMGSELDAIADIVFIYTEDGVESIDEAKKLGGGKIEYKNYPKYWDLFRILKLSRLLGFRVFNLGKEGVVTAVTEFLNANFDDSSTPIPTIKPPYVELPKFYDKEILTLFRENNQPSISNNGNAGYGQPNNNSVQEVNIQTVVHPTPPTPVATQAPKMEFEEGDISF